MILKVLTHYSMVIVRAGSGLGQRSPEPLISHSVPGKRSFDLPSPAESSRLSRVLQDVWTVFCALSWEGPSGGRGLLTVSAMQCNLQPALLRLFLPSPSQTLPQCKRLVSVLRLFVNLHSILIPFLFTPLVSFFSLSFFLPSASVCHRAPPSALSSGSLKP